MIDPPLYDAGALIAGERNDRHFWIHHRAALKRGRQPVTTAPVVAQVSRSPRQALLYRLLAGCEVVAFEGADMHEVGRLLADTGTPDVVDAHVALVAIRRRAVVLTSDPDDFARLFAHRDNAPPVVRI